MANPKTKTVTYTGSHDFVEVAGHPEAIVRGKPTKIDAALADGLHGKDWKIGPVTADPDPAPDHTPEPKTTGK
ncbi:hypothetical protein [Patulibacter defluvii]|uniref:hypothetical protein n=1 Tax=Patulibacter defluvii TaxID=3095358 RepID=UPI002A751DC9|nr:hypothetical protein [Patulibacter sp. DM4]